MKTGRRVWDCELSTIDTGFLIAGMLTAAAYFDRDDAVEAEIREIADVLYRRVDWEWAANGEAAITHGWKPETGFIPYRYEGYDEGLLLYILALGSPTHPIAPEGYAAWTSTFQWKSIYDIEYLYSGPLFTHQLSHLFIDLRGIQDPFMAVAGDRLLREHAGGRPTSSASTRSGTRSSSRCTASSAGASPPATGPGWTDQDRSRGSSGGSSTTSPGAPRSGPTTGRSPRGWWWPRCRSPRRSSCRRSSTSTRLDLGMTDSYGFKTSFNPTYEVEGSDCGWVSPWYFGIDQGPLVLMIENYRTGLLWSITKRARISSRGSAGPASRTAGSEPGPPRSRIEPRMLPEPADADPTPTTPAPPPTRPPVAPGPGSSGSPGRSSRPRSAGGRSAGSRPCSALVLSVIGLNVVNSYVNRDFMTAISERNPARLPRDGVPLPHGLRRLDRRRRLRQVQRGAAGHPLARLADRPPARQVPGQPQPTTG